MTGWLSRATEAFRRVPPAPEPFNVGCDCGDFVTGDRASAAQRPSCRNCGRPVFVLPANVYPARPKPAGRKAAAKSTSGKSPATTHREPPVASAAPAPAATKPRRGKPVPGPASATAPAVTPVEPAGILLESPTRVVTPFRLVIAAMIVISALTGWGLWHRNRVASAQTIVLAAKEAGMKALGEGDFATAARELERARDAVDLLGRADAEAASIRLFCREAVAGQRLAGDSLFKIVRDGLIAFHEGGAAARRFDGLHQGTWILFDAVVSNATVTGQPCRLDMPLIVDDVACLVEVDSTAVRAAAVAPAIHDGPARVIFAAQIERVIPLSGEDSDAILVLNGKTAFLWSNFETYAALGYRELDAEERDSTRAVLVQQATLTESSK